MTPEVLTTAAAAKLRPVDPQVWKACAGTETCGPAVGSLVYYFPQGHAEHSASSLDLPSATPCARPTILCRVSAVRLLADSFDEVFLSALLDPVIHAPLPFSSAAAEVVENGEPGGGFIHFAKILTRSDANNGGGFSVPRFCADSIFQPLNYDVGMPAQTLSVRDVHGKSWDFRHIYRGTPKRHLLTTGWSKFVNDKRLMAGDSVIFMKKSTEDLYVGLRRTSWSISSNLEYHFDALDGEEFPISTRHKFAAESVLEAIKYAEMNHQFEVMYYPSAGLPEFVMAQKEVDTAMSVYWAPGMRVRMSIEAEDSAEMTWFQGTVSSIATKDFGPWPYSPWRMLKVTWDEPNILQNIDSINPWQVELVSATTQIQAPLISPNTQILAPFHALKRMRDGEELFEMADFKSKKMVDFFPPSYNYTTFPAGMQGARHDSTNVPGLLNPKDMSSSPILSFLYGIGTAHDTEVCTELNIRSIGSIRSNSPSEGLSSPRQESNIDSGIKIFRPIPFRPSKKVNQGSFQLFGQTYEIKKPDDTR